ncbi:MAG: hypothetical protein ACYDH9_19915 [Limisphaerales bacterium]
MAARQLLLAGLLLIAVTPLCAEEQFELQQRPLTIPERGTVTSDVIMTDEYEFSFVPPTDWRTEFDAKQKKLTFYCRESNATVVLKIVFKSDGGDYELERRGLRERVRNLHPDATILQELDCHTGAGSGCAFDLEQPLPNHLKDKSRLAFIPFSNGVIEFKLSTAPKQFDHYLPHFGTLLTSFHLQPRNLAKK